jgi:Bacterial protein of unknown function (DUF898)
MTIEGSRQNSDMTDVRPSGAGRLICEFNLLESIGYLILWALICIITLGIGLFVAPYYFYKAFLNKSWICNARGEKIYRLHCEINIMEMIGHIILWILITIVTLGIGLIFYYFSTLKSCLNKTTLIRM